MADHPGPVLVRRPAAGQVQLVGAGGCPVGRGHDPDAGVSPVPGGVEPPEGCHHLVHRPGVPHRRAPDLVGQVCGQPGEELLVRLVRVDVLVPADQPEGGAQPGVVMGAKSWLTAEVREAGPTVIHVDGSGLATLDGCDQPPQDAVVEVLFGDGPHGCLDVHVGFLEDVLVQARADGELGVIVAVNESGQHKMTGRT